MHRLPRTSQLIQSVGYHGAIKLGLDFLEQRQIFGRCGHALGPMFLIAHSSLAPIKGFRFHRFCSFRIYGLFLLANKAVPFVLAKVLVFLVLPRPLFDRGLRQLPPTIISLPKLMHGLDGVRESSRGIGFEAN